MALPRRVWLPEQAEALADHMTRHFARPGGQWAFRPIQAVAIHEAVQCRGLFAPIRVGGGKTLISQILPLALGAQRPLILLPASLRKDFYKAWKEHRDHWHMPTVHIQVESYQRLSTVGCAKTLENYAPDLIVCDEAQHLKSMDAACTQRVFRYMKEHQKTVFVAMTGSMTKRSIRDFAHLAFLCLRERSPVPISPKEIEAWARALDATSGWKESSMEPGILYHLGGRTPLDGFRERMTQTPGVVATQEDPLPIQLTGSAIVLDPPPVVEDAFRRLRLDGELPDGHALEMGPALWRAARQLGLGHYLKWDPWPPEWWTEPRSAWCKASRYICQEQSNTIDTDLQLRNAVDAGQFPWLAPVLAAWREVQNDFVPNTVPVWLSFHALDEVYRKIQEHPAGIVWTDSVAFGEALAEGTGLPYYGAQGTDAKTGKFILDHPGGIGHGWVIASVESNATGRNLQGWHHNLIVSAPPSGAKWEQMLGRTHRDGQKSEEVTFDYLIACAESLTGFWQAHTDANFAETLTGQAQKLVHADLDIPQLYEIETPGYAWIT